MIFSLIFYFFLLKAALVNAQNKPCTPDKMPQLQKIGTCVSTTNFNDVCSQNNSEISISSDCSEFDGSWCCYDPAAQPPAVARLARQDVCIPDDTQDLARPGFCVSVNDLEFCALINLESTASKDCAQFDGSWCCFRPIIHKKSAVFLAPVSTAIIPLSSLDTTTKSAVVSEVTSVTTKATTPITTTVAMVPVISALASSNTTALPITTANIKPSTSLSTKVTLSNDFKGAVSSTNKILFCTPNNIPSLDKRGVCARTSNLKELCAQSNLHITKSRDCSEFDGSWCCYDPDELQRISAAVTESVTTTTVSSSGSTVPSVSTVALDMIKETSTASAIPVSAAIASVTALLEPITAAMPLAATIEVANTVPSLVPTSTTEVSVTKAIIVSTTDVPVIATTDLTDFTTLTTVTSSPAIPKNPTSATIADVSVTKTTITSITEPSTHSQIRLASATTSLNLVSSTGSDIPDSSTLAMPVTSSETSTAKTSTVSKIEDKSTHLPSSIAFITTAFNTSSTTSVSTSAPVNISIAETAATMPAHLAASITDSNTKSATIESTTASTTVRAPVTRLSESLNVTQLPISASSAAPNSSTTVNTVVKLASVTEVAAPVSNTAIPAEIKSLRDMIRKLTSVISKADLLKKEDQRSGEREGDHNREHERNREHSYDRDREEKYDRYEDDQEDHHRERMHDEDRDYDHAERKRERKNHQDEEEDYNESNDRNEQHHRRRKQKEDYEDKPERKYRHKSDRAHERQRDYKEERKENDGSGKKEYTNTRNPTTREYGPTLNHNYYNHHPQEPTTYPPINYYPIVRSYNLSYRNRQSI